MMDLLPVTGCESGHECVQTECDLSLVTLNDQTYRVMIKDGDRYIGDVDGDGKKDEWRGRFNALSPFGVGEFRFNVGEPGVRPASFCSANGSAEPYHLGERVDVAQGRDDVVYDQTIAGWSLTAAKGEQSVLPHHILVSINFYTRPLDEGGGAFHNVDDIILESHPALNTNGYRDVSSEFSLRFAKSSLDFDYRGLLSVPPAQRKTMQYRNEVRDVMQRYFKLIKDIYAFWPIVITARRNGDFHSYPDVILEYDDRVYTGLVNEMWQNSLKLLRDYEAANADNKGLRRELVGELYHRIQFSDLSWESFFYRDLADSVRKESF
ncbi:MAG: hypothetical protein HQM16_06795 [Deltaproteobacteria bacterium]|nr:hypothetical protein [Deltaproteobacteria bacterium]